MTAPDRIITHHVSPYHAIQGTPADVRRIVGRLPDDPPGFWNRCEECSAPIGAKHLNWCPEDGTVTEAQTYGGRHGNPRQARTSNEQPASAAPVIPAATGDLQDTDQSAVRND